MIPRGITRLMDMLMDREVIRETINLLSVLHTINLLILGGQQTDFGKDTNGLANKIVLVQKKVLDHLLVVGVESQWAPIAVR
ncbi:Golgin candidate 6 [Orobanche hederae]